MSDGPRTPEAGYKWVSIPEAQQTILAETAALAQVSVPLAQATGKVLASDVIAREPLPPFPASIKVLKTVCSLPSKHSPQLSRTSRELQIFADCLEW